MPAATGLGLDIRPELPIVTIPRPIDWLDFRRIAGDDAAARSRFEALVAKLVAITRPGAQHIRGDGGDWGIDVVVGELIPDEEIAVWQAKYFPNQLGRRERPQVTDSFDIAIAKAAELGYRIGHWTLVIPIRLTPAEKRWWGTFRREHERDCHVEIELWEATQLDLRISAREALHLRREYFGAVETAEPLGVEPLDDPERYDRALFVQQLAAAGITETQTARREFFNAEVLRREVRNKALEDELREFEQRSVEVLSVWEARFAGAGPSDADARRLYRDVHEALENHHRGSSLRVLRAGLIHTLGLMHYHVDERRAGWLGTWREVADAHTG